MPNISWYKKMDIIHSEKYFSLIEAELLDRVDLLNRLCERKLAFIKWAALQRLDFSPDIEQEVFSYFECRGWESLRLYNTNVKEWYRIIKEVFKRDNYTCQYCGKVGGKLECDHVLPISKGGGNEMDNLKTSCQRCNRQKKDKLMDNFLDWKKEI